MENSLGAFSHIFAHRGLWDTPAQQNTLAAITRAFEAGFSVETDIVECDSEAFISHGASKLNEAPNVRNLEFSGRVALNIKSDDAWRFLDHFNSEIFRTGSFFFDGSNPTMKQIADSGSRLANRVSELESDAAFEAQVLWLDSFFGKPWWRDEQLSTWAEKYELIVFVSPELHGLSHLEFWNEIKPLFEAPRNKIFGICTDYPFEFKEFSNK